MSSLDVQCRDGLATVTLNRGKVNAINREVVDQLSDAFKTLEQDSAVRAIILTGAGKFFSFGFDIPEFLSFSREQFAEFLTGFTDLYTYMFVYPKPIVAAINGHAIAGGCMLVLACDQRIMVGGKSKIGLNEIGFGSSVFAGSTEMLRFWLGDANATAALVSGAMYEADEARSLGLINEVTTVFELMNRAGEIANEFASRSRPAYSSIKLLLRRRVVDEMRRREGDSIKEFVEIWYSEATWENLKKITIRQDVCR